MEATMHDVATVPAESTPFDSIRRTRADGTEFWSARDLMAQLGYDKWERFAGAIDRAKISAQAQEDWVPGSGNPIKEASGQHFRDASVETTSGKGRVQLAADVHLSRFACYLVAMNGDPRKPEIAAAQRYFAIRTRQAERIEARAGGAFLLPEQPESMRRLGGLLMRLADLREATTKIEANIADIQNGADPVESIRAQAGMPSPHAGGRSDIIARIKAYVRTLNETSIREVIGAMEIERNRGTEMLVAEVLFSEGLHRSKVTRGGAREWVYVRP